MALADTIFEAIEALRAEGNEEPSTKDVHDRVRRHASYRTLDRNILLRHLMHLVEHGDVAEVFADGPRRWRVQDGGW